jgi:hypothetical protein
MAWIDVDKIKVHSEQKGEWGGDELYLTVNGQSATETTPSLNTGDWYDFTPQWTQFDHTAVVKLYEQDPWLNPDDYIASTTFYAWQAPGDDVLRLMDGNGGQYDVYFDLS